jgi:hypothetical protein
VLVSGQLKKGGGRGLAPSLNNEMMVDLTDSAGNCSLLATGGLDRSSGPFDMGGGMAASMTKVRLWRNRKTLQATAAC